MTGLNMESAHPVQKMSYTYTDHSAMCESKDDFPYTHLERGRGNELKQLLDLFYLYFCIS